MVDWTDEMDNVEWLRKSASDEWCGSALNKCADEIERLREEVERLKAEGSGNDVLLEYAQAENKRLREAIAPMREALEKIANPENWSEDRYCWAADSYPDEIAKAAKSIPSVFVVKTSSEL